MYIFLQIQLGCALNATGSIIRLFGTFDFVPESARYPVAITGQTVASLAQPFAMSMPTKVSESWFSDQQRTFSTAIGAMGKSSWILFILQFVKLVFRICLVSLEIKAETKDLRVMANTHYF